MLGQNLDFNSININNIILSNRKMSGKNKNKRKMSFVEDINIIVKEKKVHNIINNNIIINNEKIKINKSIHTKIESLTFLQTNNFLFINAMLTVN